MRKLKFSKVYLKIIASFLCMVIFASMALVFASIWFSYRDELDSYAQAEEQMGIVSSRLDETVQSLFDLCDMIMSNSLMTENFKPYSQLTGKNLYYYGSIIKLLRQGRIQFESLVDSLFLYVDEQRVLYCSGENGMTDLNTFFTKVMCYENYNEQHWRRLLYDESLNFSVLAADSYSTLRANDKHTVVPLVYITRTAGFSRVLVINLSLEKILSMYAGIQFLNEDMLAIYGEDGRLIDGSADAPEIMPEASKLTDRGKGDFIFSVSPRWLKFKIVCFIPEDYFSGSMRYFRIVIICVILAFTACGMAVSLILAKRIHAPIRDVSDSLRSLQTEWDSRGWLNNELEEIKNGVRRLADENVLNAQQTREYSWHYVAQSLTSLLDGKTLMDEQYFATLLEKDYGFKKHGYRCAIVLIDSDQRNGYLLQNELLEQMRDVLNRVLDSKVQNICLHYCNNMLALLLDSEGNDEAMLRERFGQVMDISLTSDTFSLRIGIGEHVKYLADVSKSFRDAESQVFAMASEGEFSLGGGEAFAYDRGEIIAAANSMDIKRIEEAAGEILTHAKYCGVTYGEAADIVWDILKTVLDVSQHIYPRQAPIPFREREGLNVPEILILSPEINLAPLLSVLLNYMPIQNATQQESGDKNARRMKAFIDEHYDQELSLDILAEKVGITAKYLSRIFKQSMGVNLTDYLAYVRVEKIKELLCKDLPLEQIMASVGINNRTTFIRTFRKIEGMTPTEYRNLKKEGVLNLESKRGDNAEKV